MIKNDKKSIERLASLSAEDLERAVPFLDALKSVGVISYSDKAYRKIVDAVAKARELQGSAMVYAFHVSDDYAAEQTGMGDGVELFVRYGGTLAPMLQYSGRDSVPSLDNAVDFLVRKNVNIVYTGYITSKRFLGLYTMIEDEDELRYSALDFADTGAIEDAGITVEHLDDLV